MSSGQEPFVLLGRDDACAGFCHHLFQRVTLVCRQRGIRRKICPREQNLRQVRDKSELSQPLQYTQRQPLIPIHKRAQGQ